MARPLKTPAPEGREPASFSELIAKWPVSADLAHDLGVAPATVGSWRLRDTLPARYWLDAIDSARERGVAGVSLDLLAALAAKVGGRV